MLKKAGNYVGFYVDCMLKKPAFSIKTSPFVDKIPLNDGEINGKSTISRVETDSC